MRWIAFFGLTGLLALHTPGAALAARLSYTLHVLGAPAMEADVTLTLTPDSYRITMDSRTTGLARLAFPGQQHHQTLGRFAGNRAVPLDYATAGTWRGKTRSAHLIYPNGLPTVAALVPPDDPERVPVPLAMIPGTLDPLSVIAVLLRAVRETGRCEAAARGFDGRRVLVFAATTGGEEELPPTPRSRFAGRALRCDFTNEMLAGYRAGAGREADTAIRHGTLWLAPPAPGEEAVPVRGTMATRWVGDVMLYLTAAAP